MKKILLFIVMLLLLTVTACSNKGRHVAPNAGWADEEPMLVAWQTNISNHRLWAENLGFIEDDSVKVRELIKELRTKAKASDTLVVSCLMLVDA